MTVTFRAQLQENIVKNGAEYTGDLTKDVTHLIAVKPEGRKYEYGLQWQKKVVSLQWYQDTLSRGMQLDESLYHPTTPASEQGKGAWNRRPRGSPVIGKRPRDSVPAQEPTRKLRRTASAKLGSQNDNLWNDIVGGGFESKESPREPLRSVKSMPAMRAELEHRSMPSPPTSPAAQGQDAVAQEVDIQHGFLDGKRCVIRGFDRKKVRHLSRFSVLIVDHTLGSDLAASTLKQWSHSLRYGC